MHPGGPAQIDDHGQESLDSWKEIAWYFRRSVRTVLRWERDRGLPVHRIPGGGKAAVFALKSELDAWRIRNIAHVDGDEREPSAPSRRAAACWIGAAIATAGVVAALGWSR